jgi:hypothetical protein
MDEYIRLLRSNWILTSKIHWVPIEPAKEQMMAKMVENSFDEGRTQAWVADLDHPTWFSVQGLHTVHVVSDRSVAELIPEIEKGLRIMSWLSKKPITWYWWDHPWTRSLPSKVDPGPEHLNGGWAVPGVPEVHVYRREEALKVMIHESIHALLMDVRPAHVSPVRTQFETHLGRRLWPHLGECYTELLAELLWAVTRSNSMEHVRTLWASQKACSRKQAGQVWTRIYDSNEPEKTNVFAYYILKWVLMQHEEVFFGPNHCVSRWFEWFVQALPELERLRSRYQGSESQTLSLAMTCPK